MTPDINTVADWRAMARPQWPCRAASPRGVVPASGYGPFRLANVAGGESFSVWRLYLPQSSCDAWKAEASHPAPDVRGTIKITQIQIKK